MSRILGIDLGTTNSCAAVFEGGTAHVIPNQEGARTTPSIAAYSAKEGSWLVGQIAKRQALTNPQNSVYGALRLLGKRFDSPEARTARTLAPFSIVGTADGSAGVLIQGRILSPVELCALVLMKLKQAAEDYLDDSVEGAILCVPATFDERHRGALLDAAAIAGLHVFRLTNASTAAGLAYGLPRNGPRRVAIYDLGGGTFDISILELDDGIHQTLATGGDSCLGGEDFDRLLIQWLAKEFENEHGIDVTSDRMALQRLKEAAEKAKCELSTQPQAEIILPFLSADRSGPKHLNLVLERRRFERMIEPLLERTVPICETALKEAGLTTRDIDEVIPVGGQTRTPRVLETIRRIFGREPHRDLNPDEAPAIGAAIQGGILHGEVTDLMLLDVISHSLGFEGDDGGFARVIERNTMIPTKKSIDVTMDLTNGLHILQGDWPQARENVSLGRLALDGLERMSVEATFDIDANGILQVTVLDVKNGRSAFIVVRAPSGLTQEDLERARRTLRVQEDPELLRARLTRRLSKLLSKLRELHDRVREMYEVLSVELPEGERRQIESNLIEAHRAEEFGIDEIQEAIHPLTVSLETIQTASFMALPLEERLRLAMPEWAVEDFAASRSESPEALRAVAMNAEWSALYGVRYQLVMNPRTPFDVSMRFVDGLLKEDLERVVDFAELPETLRRQARTIQRMRLPPDSAGSQNT